MAFEFRFAVLALAATIAAPATAWGMGGGLGCTNLPAYNRALGTLQGISSCDMTFEQARRIVAEHDGYVVDDRPLAPWPHARRARPSHP